MSNSEQPNSLELLGKLSDKLDDMRSEATRENIETRKCISELDKKLELHIQKTQIELEQINKLDVQQNELLDKHIEGVRTLRAMHQSNLEAADKRFQRLEAPGKWLRTTIRIFGYISAVCTAISGILYLLGLL